MITGEKTKKHSKTSTLKKEWEEKQTNWNRAISIPEGTGFCPLTENCYNVGKFDKNCFPEKAGACPQAKLYTQNKNPNAHVTKKFCSKYMEKLSQQYLTNTPNLSRI